MRIPIKSFTFYMLQMSCIHIIFLYSLRVAFMCKLYMAHLFVVVVIVILFFSKHFNLHKLEYKRRDSSIYQTFNRVERAGSELDP